MKDGFPEALSSSVPLMMNGHAFSTSRQTDPHGLTRIVTVGRCGGGGVVGGGGVEEVVDDRWGAGDGGDLDLPLPPPPLEGLRYNGSIVEQSQKE